MPFTDVFEPCIHFGFLYTPSRLADYSIRKNDYTSDNLRTKLA